MERINKLKSLLWIIIGIGAAVGITRFIFGMGVTTNMTDNTPWGFWIGFDVMGGVALAAGGFVIAAFKYIFHKHEFAPISRAAILTAFLGYLAVAIGLLFDLGLPWNIWHMIIFWNPHSPLFEVGWCVMLYLTVLFLEFAPVILERWPKLNLLAKLHKMLTKIRIPLVIAGIMLSTLHQSSLGSLFLAMPYKLHPLWYSPIIPIIFFVSAICLGLMMVMSESLSTSYLYKKEPETHIANKLRKAAIWMLLFYTVLRFADIFFRGAGVFLFDNNMATVLFWAEFMFMVIIPIFIFSLPVAKRSPKAMFIGAGIGVFGVVFNRLNVGGLTHLNNLEDIGQFYFPAWTELAISAAVVSAAMLVFFYFIENYKVWDEKPVDPQDDPSVKPVFGPNRIYLGPTKAANRTKFSLGFLIAFGFAFAFLSGETIHGEGYDDTSATKARGGDTLFVDGNKDGFGVAFKHKFHEDKGFSCGTCHHMNKPGDQATGCYECHDKMYITSDAFRHDWHADSKGANLRCFDCHEREVSKSKNSAKGCTDCHDNMIPADSETKNMDNYITMSYTDALHKQCISCHEKYVQTDSLVQATKPNLARCITCHPTESQEHKYTPVMFEEKPSVNKWVVIPPKIK